MVVTTLELAAFVAALAVIVQRERVLRRRLRRMESRFRRMDCDLRVHQRMSRVYRHVHVIPRAPSPDHPVWQPSPPTVEHLAGLAPPLSGSGG